MFKYNFESKMLILIVSFFLALIRLRLDSSPLTWKLSWTEDLYRQLWLSQHGFDLKNIFCSNGITDWLSWEKSGWPLRPFLPLPPTYIVLLSVNPGRGVQSTLHTSHWDTDNWGSINLNFRLLLHNTQISSSSLYSDTFFVSPPPEGCFVSRSAPISAVATSSSSSRDSRWVQPLASSPLTGPPLIQHNGTDCPCDTHSHTEGALLWGWVSLPPPYAPSPLECDYLHSP